MIHLENVVKKFNRELDPEKNGLDGKIIEIAVDEAKRFNVEDTVREYVRETIRNGIKEAIKTSYVEEEEKVKVWAVVKDRIIEALGKKKGKK